MATNSPKWIKETPDRLINHGDPEAVVECRVCHTFYRCGQRVEKPVKSWGRVVVENWWRYGWRITVGYRETMPMGYGVAWHEINRLTLVMHPIPFNFLMRWFREACIWMVQGGWRKFPTTQDEIDMRVAERIRIEMAMRGMK